MKLHDYFRSSAAFRVRIALNLKGLAYDSVVHNLRQNEQRDSQYLAINPQGLVPALEVGGDTLTQSVAICEYLEETHPEPALLPSDPVQRTRVRGLALAVACDIHPLNNSSVLQYLTDTFRVTERARLGWYAHWVARGFGAIETALRASPATGRFCHGDNPTLADICLVPQVYNAHRFGVSVDAYPIIRRINEACLALDAFDSARPERQADAV